MEEKKATTPGELFTEKLVNALKWGTLGMPVELTKGEYHVSGVMLGLYTDNKEDVEKMREKLREAPVVMLAMIAMHQLQAFVPGKEKKGKTAQREETRRYLITIGTNMMKSEMFLPYVAKVGPALTAAIEEIPHLHNMQIDKIRRYLELFAVLSPTVLAACMKEGGGLAVIQSQLGQIKLE